VLTALVLYRWRIAASTKRLAWTIVTCVWVALISLCCVLVGAHALFDVVGGLCLGLVGAKHEAVWRACVVVSNRMANAWSAKTKLTPIGPIRIIRHSLWAFLGAACAIYCVLYLMGPIGSMTLVVVLIFGLIGAGLWGQYFEGNRLSRPFGFYGFQIAGLLAIACLALLSFVGARSLELGQFCAALSVAACIAQAIGRLRCMEQGCCHGKATSTGYGNAYGIRVVNRMSRVLTLAHLHNVAIHPTQLYSMIGNVILACMLARLWQLHCAWTLISGIYLIVSSMIRFVEEHYRGEPQTKQVAGLSIYQWMAVCFALFGICFTMVPSDSVYAKTWHSLDGIVLSIILGMVTGVAMGVDFPNSRRRFSQLTVA
jgi:prolipoprotein diacylglyceryltransferase